MKQYLKLLNKVLSEGVSRDDRTGTGTLSLFSEKLDFDLQEGFPLLTTKRVHFKSVFYELMWFLRGDTNIKFLNDHGVTIWDEWADDNGGLGNIYGAQWRNWDGIDQIQTVIDTIINDPTSRRMIVNAWNVGEIDQMALPPCHMMFQFYVENNKLSCQIYQRSCDVFLGLPFNIASYALLTNLLAARTGLGVDKLHWIGGDVHLYKNHIEQAKLQLARQPRRLPTFTLNTDIYRKDILGYIELDEIILEDYNPHPTIKAPIAI